MTTKSKIITVTLFSIAMGFMENAVVVYLRALYYEDGFNFPLRPMNEALAKVEMWREFATMVMLICIGRLAARKALERFSYFILSFAIWDLFYYIFLYVCLGWPASIFTWDILFLLPVPWVGPVWAPCILCIVMVTGSIIILNRSSSNPNLHIAGKYWAMMIMGALICIFSFMWDYLQLVRWRFWEFYSEGSLFEGLLTYTPQSFNYPLFFAGFVLMCSSFLLFTVNSKTNSAS